MPVPLNSLTQQPVRYSTFSFGGDDRKRFLNPLFKGLVQWQIDIKKENASEWKANAVYGVKKLFAFLDRVGMGTCFYGLGGFTYRLKETKYFLTAPERNAAARERIVAALNCNIEDIPVVQIHESELSDYLKLEDRHFRSGQCLIQGEDPAGRKFLGMRLQDRNGQVQVATIHQRYRETCVMAACYGGGGRLWTVNFADLITPPPVNIPIGNLDAITDFIAQIRQNRHPVVSFSNKP